jgi:integrase
MRHRLTDQTVKKLPVPEKGNKVYYDTLVDGFGLRVTANGARSYVFNYRVRATKVERRYTIGSIDKWDAVPARARAKELNQLIDAGGDPLKELEVERAAPTVADLAKRHVEEHLPRKRPRSRIEDERLLPIILDALGADKVADVTYADIDALHRKVTRERGPFRANRVYALLSKMFSLAIKWKLRSDNPCKGVEKNDEPKRQRYLSGPEIERLTVALDAEPDQQGADIVRLLLLTGARSAEVLSATWDQFNLDTGVWTKPHTSTKQKEEHRLPLSDEAVELLKRLYAGSGIKAKYVFPGDSPLKPRASIRHFWERIRKAADLGDVRIHDLRHSHASLLVNAGYSLPVIGAVLGHKTPSTTARYAHLADDTLRHAVKSVEAKILPMKARA